MGRCPVPHKHFSFHIIFVEAHTSVFTFGDRHLVTKSTVLGITEVVRQKGFLMQFIPKCHSLKLSIDLNKQETPRNTKMLKISGDNHLSATMETL